MPARLDFRVAIHFIISALNHTGTVRFSAHRKLLGFIPRAFTEHASEWRFSIFGFLLNHRSKMLHSNGQ
jgi:hypothetical protein